MNCAHIKNSCHIRKAGGEGTCSQECEPGICAVVTPAYDVARLVTLSREDPGFKFKCR